MADKEETVVLRMSGEIKAEIKAAAECIGQSMTTFITDAALKKAHQIKRHPPSRAGQRGVPAYFRALCVEAANGGASGYATAGWHLAAGLSGERPYEIGPAEWEERIDALKALLANQDDDAIWEWFQEHFPKFMVLIPARRREQFLYGVRRAYDGNLLDV